MADGTSAEAAAPGPTRYLSGMQHYGTIAVVGGGCYGSWYVRQLGRASRAGAVKYDRLLVVDRDPECRVARALRGEGDERIDAPSVGVAERDWSTFFDAFLAEAGPMDAIVPSPLMPHLVYEWALRRARARWPGRRVGGRPIGREPSVPWQRAAPDGTHYVSFAEWMCPVNCIEPALCPVISGPRTWSLPPAVRAYVAAERARGRALGGPALVHCAHRTHGVGMFGTAEVLAVDRTVREAVDAGATEVLVGTVSHCHGALCVLSVEPDDAVTAP